MGVIENQLSVKQWVFTILLLAIPIVNIVLLFIWAFGEKNNKTNYARALLIVGSIYIILVIILSIMGSLLAFFSYDNYSYGEEEVGVTYVSDYVNEEIEVLEIILEQNEREYGEYITGKIQNNSTTRTHSSISLDINFYNESNSVIDSYYINFDVNIPPGEVYEFREFISDVYVERIAEAASVKIQSIQ